MLDEFEDVPGTTIFNAQRSRLGYRLNQFCMSLMKAENRERFKADEKTYLAEWRLSDEQLKAVLTRDYNRMIAAGGNIYFLSKLGATDGRSFQYLAASMTGVSQEDYAAMMVAGGRSAQGLTSKKAIAELAAVAAVAAEVDAIPHTAEPPEVAERRA